MSDTKNSQDIIAGDRRIALAGEDHAGWRLDRFLAAMLPDFSRSRLKQLLDADAERRTQNFERIALELQRSLDHFDRQYHYVPIAKLLLAPLPQEIGLQEYLASNIYVPVESIDLGTVLDFPAVPELKHPERQAQCLQTIGAALRDDKNMVVA